MSNKNIESAIKKGRKNKKKRIDYVVQAMLSKNGSSKTKEDISSIMAAMYLEDKDPNFDVDTKKGSDDFFTTLEAMKYSLNSAFSNASDNRSLSFNPKYRDLYILCVDDKNLPISERGYKLTEK